MSGDTAAIATSLGVAAAAWAFMFLPPRRGIWPRTWVAAGTLVLTAGIALAAVDRLGDVVHPVTAVEVAIGLGVGAAWLVVTHVGYAAVAMVFPSFAAQVQDLYGMRDEGTTARMVGPVAAMGIAEEAVFRGVVQGLGGFALGLVTYTAVQLFERKWALVLAAALGGAVWGAVFAWRGGLVAPVVAHVVWTGALTFLWPLGRPLATPRDGRRAAGA